MIVFGGDITDTGDGTVYNIADTTYAALTDGTHYVYFDFSD